MNAHYIYFVIITLFFKRFYKTFGGFRKDRHNKNDYVKAELKTKYPMYDIAYGRERIEKEYKNQYLISFNEFMDWIEKDQRTTHELDGEKLSSYDIKELKELTDIYGG